MSRLEIKYEVHILKSAISNNIISIKVTDLRICTIKICCSNAYITFMKQYGTKHCCINYQFQIKFLRYLEQAIKYSRHTS